MVLNYQGLNGSHALELFSSLLPILLTINTESGSILFIEGLILSELYGLNTYAQFIP